MKLDLGLGQATPRCWRRRSTFVRRLLAWVRYAAPGGSSPLWCAASGGAARWTLKRRRCSLSLLRLAWYVLRLAAWGHFRAVTDGSGWAPAGRLAGTHSDHCRLPQRAGHGHTATALCRIWRLCADLEQPPPGFANLGLAGGLCRVAWGHLPEDVQALPVQQHSVNWLAFIGQAELGLLADDMGLGKTLQALCTIHGRTLVVTPAVCYCWAKEIRRFSAGLRYAICHRRSGARYRPDVGPDYLCHPRLDTATWPTGVGDGGAGRGPGIKNLTVRWRAAYRMTAASGAGGTPVESSRSCGLDAFPSLVSWEDDSIFRNATPNPSAGQLAPRRLRASALYRHNKHGGYRLPPRTVVLRRHLGR
jgi:hypothetical protein